VPQAPRPPAGKTCVRCGKDCAGRPRFRTGPGRYICVECLEQAKAAHRRQTAGAAASAATSGADPARAAAADDGEIGLEPLDVPGSSPCPVCMAPILRGHHVCARCGMDQRKGVESSTWVERTLAPRKGRRAPTCPTCGYDMTGLRELKCPECGTVLTPAGARKAAEKRLSARRVRNVYLVPLLMFVFGAGFASAAMYGLRGTAGVGAYWFTFGFEVAIAIAVFWVCQIIWIGVDAPMHLNLLRLCGCYAAVDAANVIFSLIPVLGLAWILSIALYIALLTEMLDLEVPDALIVACATFVVKYLIVVAVLSWWLGLV
jgi:hypothetical protein